MSNVTLHPVRASREHPILCSAPMVLSIRAGRKTQTRRIIKKQFLGSKAYPFSPKPNHDGLWSDTKDPVTRYFGCPWGVVGDRLYVREKLIHGSPTWLYAADQKPVTLPADHPSVGAMFSWAHHQDRDYCPSVHMPRWASRITLEIVKVRVERLQDISEADAIAEGLYQDAKGLWTWSDVYRSGSNNPRYSYELLWDLINGHNAWAKNPWVWVIEWN